MDYMEKLKKMLCAELEDYGEQKSLSVSDLEKMQTNFFDVFSKILKCR